MQGGEGCLKHTPLPVRYTLHGVSVLASIHTYTPPRKVRHAHAVRILQGERRVFARLSAARRTRAGQCAPPQNPGTYRTYSQPPLPVRFTVYVSYMAQLTGGGVRIQPRLPVRYTRYMDANEGTLYGICRSIVPPPTVTVSAQSHSESAHRESPRSAAG